jgi:hypothetical protein
MNKENRGRSENVRSLSEADRNAIQAAIDANGLGLAGIAGFLAARPGFPIRAGRLHRVPAIVVYVRRKLSPLAVPAGGAAPAMLGGFPVDVRMADPETQMEMLHPEEENDFGLAAHYEGIDGNPINTKFEIDTPIYCHVGPDSGWIPLRDFIAETQSSFNAAIYDFGAAYIAQAISDVVHANGISVRLNIDSTMNAEEKAIQTNLAETLGDSYASQTITCGGTGAFPSAYHEKVIVRDDEWVWISSGNWTKNSQPETDPIGDPATAKGMYKTNREYHLILQHEGLAAVFSQYIEHDREQAANAAAGAIEVEERPDLFVSLQELTDQIGLAALAAPEPVAPEWLPSVPRRITVWPVLSPDNYSERISALVHSAQRSLYLQYSYITWSAREKDQDFRDLLLHIGELSNREGFDLKVIVGSASAAEKVAVLAENGWNDAKVHTQSPIHNKAIIVDGERVLVSSQNWSGDGFLWNRDAGIIIDDKEIAEYFERVFIFDWENRSRSPFEASLGAIVAEPEAPTPPGMVRMRWRDYYGD